MKAVTDTRYYDEIAKEINLLNKETKIYFPSELTDGVRMVSENRYAEGYRDGEESGRQAQYDEFWDTYQKNPDQLETPPKINYKYMFGGAGWNSETFKPKYDMIGSSFERTFHSTGIEEIDVTIDMSGSTGATQMFYGASSLRKIARLIPPPFAIVANVFESCNSLEEINFGGLITKNLDMSECPNLNKTTLASIVDNLATVTVATTLTLHAKAEARLTDAQRATIDEKGWTLAV